MANKAKEPTEEEIKGRITFASDLYSTARNQMDEDEKLFTGQWVLEDEVKDLEIETPIPPRPMAIVFKFLSRLAVRAEMGIQLVPKVLSDKEEEICTKLERWLEGYKFRAEYEAEDPIYRYFVTWFLVRGRGCLELRLRDEYAESDEHLVIEPVVDDPYKICPVYGSKGIMYYAKEYKRYVWDLRSELEGRAERSKEFTWTIPDALRTKGDTTTCQVQEYWDRDWHAALIDKEFVYLKPNRLGFVPLRQAKAMDTPLEDAEWASQSILHPISDMLKKQAELMSKGITGLEVFYYPWILVQEPGGRSYIIESTPGTIQNIHPDAKITVLNPTPNQALLHQLGLMVSEEINLMTLPEISWGAEPGSLQSGRAVSQVLSQTLDVIEDKRQNLERALGRHFGDILKLVETYGQLGKEGKFSVMAMPKEPGRKRRDLVAIGKDDVEGHNRVIVNLSPPLPEDKMVRYEIARRAREIGKDGFPLMDDYTILAEILEVKNPDEVKERLEKQIFERMSPEIIEYKRQKALEAFCEQEDIKIEELKTTVQPGLPPGVQEGAGVGQMGQLGQPPPEAGVEEPTAPGVEELAMMGAMPR